jgi:hypothetical protein
MVSAAHDFKRSGEHRQLIPFFCWEFRFVSNRGSFDLTIDSL